MAIKLQLLQPTTTTEEPKTTSTTTTTTTTGEEPKSTVTTTNDKPGLPNTGEGKGTLVTIIGFVTLISSIGANCILT